MRSGTTIAENSNTFSVTGLIYFPLCHNSFLTQQPPQTAKGKQDLKPKSKKKTCSTDCSDCLLNF